MKKYILIFFIIFNNIILIYGANIEDFGVGARPVGMNNAFIGLCDDVYSLYYNPAGLSNLKFQQLTFSYEKLYLGLTDGSDLNNGFFGFVYSLEKIGNFGIGWLNFSLVGYYKENMFIIAYSRKIFDQEKVSFGVKLKILTKEYGKTLYTENAVNLQTGETKTAVDPVFLNGYLRSVFSLDLGFLYKINQKNSFGFVIQNINQPDFGFYEKDIVNLTLKLGYAYINNDINFTSDFIYKQDEFNLRFGTEKWFFNNQFAVRGGFGFGCKECRDLSFGLSYKYNNSLQLDYSFFYPLTGITNFFGTHQISFSYKFPNFSFLTDVLK